MLAHQSSSSINIPPDQYLAYCYGCVGLGTQKSTWQGEEKQLRRVALLFVLPTVLLPVTEDGKEPKPATMFKTYTLSLDDKSNLKPELENWLGRALTPEDKRTFDLFTMVGKPGLAQVISSANSGKPILSKIGALPSWMRQNLPLNPFADSPIKYDISDGKNMTFQRLFPYLQGLVEKSAEFARNAPAPTNVVAVPQQEQAAVQGPAQEDECTPGNNNPF